MSNRKPQKMRGENVFPLDNMDKFPNFLGPQAIYYVDFPWQTTRILNAIFKEFRNE
jgi:hypothetical protein